MKNERKLKSAIRFTLPVLEAHHEALGCDWEVDLMHDPIRVAKMRRDIATGKRKAPRCYGCMALNKLEQALR